MSPAGLLILALMSCEAALVLNKCCPRDYEISASLSGCVPKERFSGRSTQDNAGEDPEDYEETKNETSRAKRHSVRVLKANEKINLNSDVNILGLSEEIDYLDENGESISSLSVNRLGEIYKREKGDERHTARPTPNVRSHNKILQTESNIKILQYLRDNDYVARTNGKIEQVQKYSPDRRKTRPEENIHIFGIVPLFEHELRRKGSEKPFDNPINFTRGQRLAPMSSIRETLFEHDDVNRKKEVIDGTQINPLPIRKNNFNFIQVAPPQLAIKIVNDQDLMVNGAIARNKGNQTPERLRVKRCLNGPQDMKLRLKVQDMKQSSNPEKCYRGKIMQRAFNTFGNDGKMLDLFRPNQNQQLGKLVEVKRTSSPKTGTSMAEYLGPKPQKTDKKKMRVDVNIAAKITFDKNVTIEKHFTFPEMYLTGETDHDNVVTNFLKRYKRSAEREYDIREYEYIRKRSQDDTIVKRETKKKARPDIGKLKFLAPHLDKFDLRYNVTPCAYSEQMIVTLEDDFEIGNMGELILSSYPEDGKSPTYYPDVYCFDSVRTWSFKQVLIVCPCTKTGCIKKCCPNNMILTKNGNHNVCVRSNSKNAIKWRPGNSTHVILQNKRPKCPETHTAMLFDKEQYVVFENTTAMIRNGNRNILEEAFCVDLFLDKNKGISEKIMVCREDTSHRVVWTLFMVGIVLSILSLCIVVYRKRHK